MERLTDEEVIQKVKEYRQDCEIGNVNLFERMVKAHKFANTSDQWDPADRAYRERKRKFCLTIPLCASQVNQVMGSQIQNPKDVVVSPERTGSSTGARILTRLAKHALDAEYAVHEETEWCHSGIATGMGLILATIDKHEDPIHGNLTIEKLNEFECGFDPHCTTKDINSYIGGAKYFIWEPWVDKDLIHEKYPDKVDDISGTGEAGSLWDKTGFWSSFWNECKSAVGTIIGSLTGYHPAGEDNINKYRYKVTHTWWRRPKKCYVAYIHGESEVQAVTLIKDDEIKEAKRLLKQQEQARENWQLQRDLQPGEWPAEIQPEPKEMELHEVIINVMYHTVRIGDTLLENIEDELNGVTKFPVGVYSAYCANGYRKGIVEDMIGTQEEINWTHSQALMVIKHLSTYHWRIGKDATGKNREWLEENADEDNLVIDESLFGDKVEKSESRPYLGGLDRMSEIAKENLKLISNVRTEDPSFDNKNMSGKAIALKQLNSQTGQASVFANFDYALRIFADLIVEIIRANDIYSPDEIRAIVEEDDLLDAELMEQAREQVRQILQQSGVEIPEPPQMPQGGVMGAVPDPMQIAATQQEMMLFAKFNMTVDKLARPIAEDMLMEEIGNLRKGRYTTKVTVSSYAPTMRMAEYAEVMELNKVLLESRLPPLSRKQLIEASDVKNKDQILQEDAAMQQAPQLAPQGMALPAMLPQMQKGAA